MIIDTYWLAWGLCLVCVALFILGFVENLKMRKVLERRSMPSDVLILSTFAAALVRRIEQSETTASGENKRHQVYAAMIKERPDVPRYKIGLAVEWAVYQIKK